jgi:hypothetical protein
VWSGVGLVDVALRVVTFPRVIVKRSSAVAACLLVSVVLSGCADDEPGPTALPSVSPGASASPSVTAAPGPVAVPVAAQAATPKGAAEFARFFYAEVERAYEERDPEIVARLGAPGCEACGRFVASLTSSRDNDERVEGAVYEITFAEAPEVVNDRTVVAVIYDGPEAVRYSAEGAVIDREPAVAGFEEELLLVRSGLSWLVEEVRAV